MKIFLSFLFVLSFALFHAGCGSKPADGKTDGGGGPAAMSVPVETARVTTERIEEKLSAVGTLEANESVDIKSEIDAVVESINFTEGASVKKGQSLVKFDAAKWRAQYQQAKVELE